MKRRTQDNTGCIMLVVYLVVIIGGIYGYGSNIYKLYHNDFKEPYKTEVIRGIGCFLPPIGVILGYFNFKDESRNR